MSTIDPSHSPRNPTTGELQELTEYLLSEGYDAEDAAETAASAYAAVYDHYSTGGPGYVGKLMSVVWDSSPFIFDVFTWEDGKMERSDREIDTR